MLAKNEVRESQEFFHKKLTSTKLQNYVLKQGLPKDRDRKLFFRISVKLSCHNLFFNELRFIFQVLPIPFEEKSLCKNVLFSRLYHRGIFE
jgi:hypothetical protein